MEHLLMPGEGRAHVREDMNLLIDQRMSMDVPLWESPAHSGEDAALSTIEEFALAVHETATASIRAIENAVQVELMRGTFAKQGGMPDVHDAASRALLKSAPKMYGMGFITDPSFSSPPSAECCYAPEGADLPRRLDPDIEFYDVTTAPWWPADDAGETVRTRCAYVDVSGTDENLVTFSKQTVKDGNRVGVAAVDLLLKQIQAGFEQYLRRLPPGICIVARTTLSLQPTAEAS